MLTPSHSKIKVLSLSLSSFLLLTGLVSCGQNTSKTTTENMTEEQVALAGDIAIDGSSTVFPITEAMAEEFQNSQKDVRISIGISGTGGGFKKFCSGETDISNASRPIKPAEIEQCEQAGVEYIELPVGYDALSVVIHPENDWAACLTQEELNIMWNPEAQGKINNWNQVRSSFPDLPLKLYGPGTDSGTFDYFTEAINGKGGKSRGDFTASEDDNVIVQGVSANKGALGYLGLSYLEENLSIIKAVAIDNEEITDGEGCIEPTIANVENGTYQPLARPMFIYVRKSALERPEVLAFVNFYLKSENSQIVDEVGYIHLPESLYEKVNARLEQQKTGTVFTDGSSIGVKLAEVL